MLTQAISPIFGREEQKSVLLTQTGSNGNNGGRSTNAIALLGPEDDEPQAVAQAAEAFLIRQRIDLLLNVTDHRNEMTTRTPLREQRAYATLAIFSEGGAM